MTMEKIICQQCGAPILWDGVSTRLQCSFCGMVYERKASRVREPMQRYLDRQGKELLVGYYPPMFHGAFQIRDMGSKVGLSCAELPFKVFYEMTSADQSAHILFVSGTTYHHIDNTPANAGKQNMVGGDLKRYRSYVGADAYADIRFFEEHPRATGTRVITVEQPCAELKENLDKLRIQRQNSPNMRYHNEFAGKIYSYVENGVNQVCLTRLALESVETPAMGDRMGSLFGTMGQNSAQLRGGMLGGMLGNLGRAFQGVGGMNGFQNDMSPSASRNITWTVFNEMFFWGTEAGVQRYWSEFQRVYETIQLGPDFFKAIEYINRSFNNLNQTLSSNAVSMANAQMASSQRIGNMINDTYAYGMELDRQSWANTSATMDRVNIMRSEAQRGVNSYATGNGDFVEADVRYDNVYQSNRDSNVYAGVEGDFDMGSEWTMLKKRF